jgi:arylsulfatase A-like enzyme
MIGMIDDGVGQILNRLEALGIRDDTIVVFTSDHGDMMGEHGLFLKGFMHYRGTLQVPLVVDVPGLSPGRTRSLASSIDLGPTLMDLCGITAYDGVQGQSLSPILQDADAQVRESVLIEDDVPVITSKLTPIPARTRTLVKGDYRYTRNTKGEEQLFNLVQDPDEVHDVKSTDPTRSEMVEALADAMMLADDSSRGAPSTGIAKP